MRKLLYPVCLAFAAAPVEPSAASDTNWDVTDTGQPYTDAAFTLSEGSWMSVDVSPDGNTLAFDLLGDIYTMPATGGAAHVVLGGPAIQRNPNFSPKGDKLLFVSDAGGNDNLWVADVDGTHPRQVSHERVNLMGGPAWAPDGEHAAVERRLAIFSKTEESQIRIYDLRGGDGRVLVPAPANKRDLSEAQFSPDGRYLYYTHRLTDTRIYVDANHINFGIERRDLRTGDSKLLISGFGGATTPRVSPDGRHLAFVRRVKTDTVLFDYNTQTHEQRPVYDDLDRDLQGAFVPQDTYYPQFGWFPDNRHVAIWGKGKLYKVDMVTGEHQLIPFTVTAHHRITDAVRISYDIDPPTFKVKIVSAIAVSPNGRELAFHALGRLWRKHLPDGAPVRQTQGVAYESEPAYSPDGNELAYADWDDEKGGALRQASTNGKVTTLATSKGAVRTPQFSPDGSRIVYRIESGNVNMGAARARGGLYWIAAAGGTPHFITADGETPLFSPDGKRIYFVTHDSSGDEMVSRIESATLSGLDRRRHAAAETADISEITISPNLQWIAFKQAQQYYVVPYNETGTPLTLNADTREVSVARLTETSGYALSWSTDSSTLYWMLGPALYHVAVAGRFKPGTALPGPSAEIGLTGHADIPDGTIAFTNAHIITMQGDKVIPNGTIVVTRNRIAALGPAGQVSLPQDAKVYDVEGKTIMPGLVDMHGHIDCCYYGGMMPQKQPSLYAALAFGVTTNYDPYTSELPAFESMELQRIGLTVAPRVINVGRVIYGRSGKYDSAYTAVNSFEQARNIMRRKRALGGTIIKSYKQPARRQRQQLIKAGREFGVMSDAEGESHFYTNISMILDGHWCLEHNLPLANYYDDVIQLMAHSKSCNTPTLIVTFGEMMGENYYYQHTRAWDDPKIQKYVQEVTSWYSPIETPSGAPPYVRGMTTIHAADDIYDIGFRSVARSVKKQDDAGVVINVGSHGEIYGLAMHWEMWLMKQGDMSNMRVLRAATINGAKSLAMDRQIGSLEVGKLADLIVLDGDPLKDIKNTNTVRYTMVNGRLYNSLTMDEIGNYDRPRTKFYWELDAEKYHGIDWNASWAGK